MERRNGIIRSKRWNNDLLDSPFQVDQRSFAEIMGYITSFLEKINYYNLQNEIDGNWRKLIEDDPVLYMVSIINEPTSRLESMIEDYQDATKKEYVAPGLISDLLEWYNKINAWHDRLLKFGETKLAHKIKNALTHVLDDQKPIIEKLNTQWLKEYGKMMARFTSTFVLTPIMLNISNELDFKRTLHLFKKVIVHIQIAAEEALKDSLVAENTHMPHNAMYIAFGILFKTVQEKLNTLSQRHLDFYYKDILKQTPNASQPTKTTVSFNLLPTIENPSLIRKGTQLSAGKLFGSKTEVLFETDEDLVAHNIELMEMETFFFSSSPYIRVGTKEPIISSVSKNKLIALGKDVQETRNDWFVFGANKDSLQDSYVDPEHIAKIGFIIGSPVLLLSEGKREITLHVNMEESTSGKSFWKLLAEIQNTKKLSLETAIDIVFEDGLNISYTGKKGWLMFENYTVSYDEQKNNFSIHLVLENSAPPLEKSTAIEENLSWPSIKVELNNYAPVYLYSFLKDVEINSIKIDVDVQRMRNLSLYNNLGKMPVGKSFDLFGPFPAVGSYLMVGKPELFQKQVNAVEVQLEWENMPLDFGGFDTYYDGYSETITNDSFKVRFTALSNNFWLPLEQKNVPDHNLFTTTKCLSPEGYESVLLDDSNSIDFKGFNTMGIPEDPGLKEPLEYTVNTQSGFVKLTLSEPSIGFGHDLYQKDFTEIATYNAKNNRNVPYPNRPFVPKVKGVSVNYKATDTLFFNVEDSKKNKGELVHIRPFWVDPAIIGDRVTKYTLFPKYDSEGYLVMGLKGIEETIVITMFFYFLRSGSTNNIPNDTVLRWEYFDLDEWVPLENEEILKDGTNGLTKSGTIELRLPKVEKPDEELYWIRISVKKNAEHYPRIKGIYFNAVRVTCTSNDPLVIGKNLEPESINKVMGKLPDIKKVVQPGSSFGGTFEETKEEFYGRVSERLRHKSRSVCTWDYERLLLEKFNTVALVKCTNLDKRFHPVPGNVKVVVLNSKWSTDERYYFKKATLNYMRDYLKRLASPFITIEVINPNVEYLLVKCVINLKREDNAGYFLDLINDEISKFLSPISNIDNGMGGIGGKVIPRVVRNFIEKLDYVKSVESLSIEHIIRKRANDFSLGIYIDAQEIKATTPWSILNPVKKHHVVSSVVKNPNIKNVFNIGIANMEIGTDFILQPKPKKISSKPDELDQVLEYPSNAVFEFKNKS